MSSSAHCVCAPVAVCPWWCVLRPQLLLDQVAQRAEQEGVVSDGQQADRLRAALRSLGHGVDTPTSPLPPPQDLEGRNRGVDYA